MTGQKGTSIFISYARQDGVPLAQQLSDDLRAEGFDAWLDTKRIESGAGWTQAIEEALDRCYVVLALLTPGSYVSEICRAEQLRALRKGKRVIPLLARSDADRPLYLEAKQYRDFTSSVSYRRHFQELIGEICGGASAVLNECYRSTPILYVTAPPLVANYLERTETLRNLRDALFSEADRKPIAITAITGMGGIGKTVLAQALVNDEIVQAAFPDGIVWITAGREAVYDLVTSFREIGKTLGDSLSHYENQLACVHRFRTLLAHKAVLIVLDDVWNKSDLDPFLASSKASRLLFTTRDVSIAKFAGAQLYPAELLDEKQCRELIAAWAGMSREQLPPASGELIVECDRLPLALAVMGALLRGAGPAEWADAVNLMRKADLSAITELLPPGQESFFRAVEISVKSLVPVMQERYQALAPVLEQTFVPLPILETLWSVEEGEARRIARHFADRSLVERNSETGSIRLHDLQLDYVRAQYPEQQALLLILGAVRLSSRVLEKDPSQFASQITGRLLAFESVSGVEQFNSTIANGTRTPWIRLLCPALHPPGTGLVRTLEGHAKAVVGVAVSSDGRYAVSASHDHTLKVWDLERGLALASLEGHSGAVTGVALDQNAQRVVSTSFDKSLRVWDLGTGLSIRTLRGHSEPVFGVSLGPNGAWAISASGDRTLKTWDLEAGRVSRTLKGHLNPVSAVAISMDGVRAISASWDNSLKTWDLHSGRVLRTLEGHQAPVSSVVMSADGLQAVSASWDGTLKIWDLERGRLRATLTGHSSAIASLAATADWRRVVSASGDHTVKVWDLESGTVVSTLEGHYSDVFAVAITPDGRRAVSGSRDTTLKVWDLQAGPAVPKFDRHSASVWGVAVSADGQRAISASRDKTLKLWNAETGEAERTLGSHSEPILGVAVDRDARLVVSCSMDETLRVWDAESGNLLRTLKGHTEPVYRVAVSADGRFAVSASGDHTLRVWDLSSGEAVHTLKGHSDSVLGVDISPNLRYAVSASWDKTLKIWNLATGQLMRTLEGHSDQVSATSFSPDGHFVASGSWDETVRIWDCQTGEVLLTLKGHSGPIYDTKIDSGGRWLATASRDKTIRVWNLQVGALAATFTCDADALCCAWTAGGRIVAGDKGGSVYFLSFRTGR